MVQKASKRDTVLAYFAGFTIELDGNYYFCAHDSQIVSENSLVQKIVSKNSLVNVNAVCDVLARSDAAVKILVIDSHTPKQQTHFTVPKGVAVLLACSPGQHAIEVTSKGGLLTSSLCEGLEGAADVNKDSQLTWSELVDYVCERVAT